MIYKLASDQMQQGAALVEGVVDTLVWSCIQGHMGQAWVDQLEHPTAIQIIVGDFCFYAGVCNEALLAHLPEQLEYMLVVFLDEGWAESFEIMYTGVYDKFMRYAIRKGAHFDREQLTGYIDQLPEQYTLRPIDEQCYKAILQEDWCRDLCAQFVNYEDYAKRGVGFVVMEEDRIVSGASSYTVYDGGIEIEIDTRLEYRRQKLALICGARLVLECLDRGLCPSWDAANLASVALAGKLGYVLDHEYVTYGLPQEQVRQMNLPRKRV